jgi:hypothetical protein
VTVEYVVEYVMEAGESAERDARHVVRRHEDRLLALPQVTGVGVGADPVTGAPVVVVYVTRKLPREQLMDDELVPPELDGIPVMVAEVGTITAQDEPRA